MADIRSRPSTNTYREGWERIFGPKQAVPDRFKADMDFVLPGKPDDYLWFAPEDLDAHPTAD